MKDGCREKREIYILAGNGVQPAAWSSDLLPERKSPLGLSLVFSNLQLLTEI